jgi:hypothetical protein
MNKKYLRMGVAVIVLFLVVCGTWFIGYKGGFGDGWEYGWKEGWKDCQKIYDNTIETETETEEKPMKEKYRRLVPKNKPGVIYT